MAAAIGFFAAAGLASLVALCILRSEPGGDGRLRPDRARHLGYGLYMGIAKQEFFA